MRVVAVLGYSPRRANGLHPIAAVRLRHAERVPGADAVIFSGRGSSGEAHLMHEAWSGRDAALVRELTARNTAENAAGIAAIARRLGAHEVVVVTSRWHAPRAQMLLRAVLRGTGIAVRVSSPRDRLRPRLLAREAACIVAVPYHLLRSGVKRG